MNFRLWMKCLGAAAAGGAFSTASQLVLNRSMQQPGAPPITGDNLWQTALIGGVIGVLGYLKQSPIPTTPVADVAQNQAAPPKP